MFYFIRAFTAFFVLLFFGFACLNPQSALAADQVITDENWATLEGAFDTNTGVQNNETVSYTSPGTNFGANPTIAVTKTGVTLLGNGGNRTALDALLDKIPGWIANDDWPADFNAQLDAALANITTGMTTYTGSPRISPLFLNTEDASMGFSVSNIHFEDYKFNLTTGSIEGGGLVYVQDGRTSADYLNNQVMTITDSSFFDNSATTATAVGGNAYGMFSFDTSNSATEQQVSLIATNGNNTNIKH